MDIKDLKKLDLSYPRPLCRRSSFIDLNGEWDFLLEESDVGEREPRYKEFPEQHLKINVPFCYQSPLSKVNIQKRYDTVWYQKDVKFVRKENQRVIFHIDASDYITYLYVNNVLVGKHQGGYTAFSFDITPFLKDNFAHIAIRCDDSYNLHQPRGKQKWRDEPFGCWYQEVTGVWKSVWAEVVEDSYIDHFKLTPNRNGSMDVEIYLNKHVLNESLSIKVYYKGREVNQIKEVINGDHLSLNVPLKGIHYWDISSPELYDVEMCLSGGDNVKTIFGYRFINTKDAKIYLNDKELYMRLCLEQGYYKEGIYTFKDNEQLINEVTIIKESGFNGLRMHQKVEDDRFYYLCDLLGLVVWSEMPSSYDFDDDTRINTIREWKEVMWQHYNHPSILVWTPINESWGVPGIRHNKEQHDFLVELYQISKEFDKTRLVVSNDGWEHCITDLVTLHNYIQDPDKFKSYLIDNIMDIVVNNKNIDTMNNFIPWADGFKYEGQPILIDEFCGIGFNVNETNAGWGYGDQVKQADSFLDRYTRLIAAVESSSHIAGWCMTQITDVYQEINGLFTMDRKPKLAIEKFYKANNQN